MSDLGEFTAYALSRDGLNYHDLNEGKAVMDPEQLALIEGGQRDAYVCRKSDSGKGYLMVTTDMCVRKSKQWFNYGINLLKSDDLIHWTSTTFDFRKGNEIFCDPESPDVIADWSKIKHDMIAGDDGQLYVIVKDNRGNYSKNREKERLAMEKMKKLQGREHAQKAESFSFPKANQHILFDLQHRNQPIHNQVFQAFFP